jgi:hypothetical protein
MSYVEGDKFIVVKLVCEVSAHSFILRERWGFVRQQAVHPGARQRGDHVRQTSCLFAV